MIKTVKFDLMQWLGQGYPDWTQQKEIEKGCSGITEATVQINVFSTIIIIDLNSAKYILVEAIWDNSVA